MQLSELESLLPLACSWVREQETEIVRSGVALNAQESQVARSVGVTNPERVRLLQVLVMPEPTHSTLRAAMQQSGFFTGNAAGLTLSYGIYIVRSAWRDFGLVAHELVHVAQYERLGGCEEFLRQYLGECLSVGYFNAPLEIEAREVSRRVLEALR